MKKILCATLVAILFAQILSAQVVNIPDAILKIFLVGRIDINTNDDDEIQLNEAAAYEGSILIPNKKIQSLVGLEAFTKLTRLDCSDNPLSNIDVSKNIALKNLNCSLNQLTSLDVSKNVALVILDCFRNKFTNLDCSSNIALEKLYCYKNNLINLNVSKNIALKDIDCSENQLTSVDIRESTSLKKLTCYINQLTSLDVTQNVALVTFEPAGNKITSLNIEKNTALKYFYCRENMLKSIDVSKNIALVGLECSKNQLMSVDVSKNIVLIYLYCHTNKLTSLNLKNGKNDLLTSMNAGANPNLSCISVDNPDSIPSDWFKDNQATYNTQCTVSTTDAFSESLMLYPNPVTNKLSVRWATAVESMNLELFNTHGVLVVSRRVLNQGNISVADLPKGLYLCRIKDDNRLIQTSKVVIE